MLPVSVSVVGNCIEENSAGGQLGHTTQSSKSYTAVFPPSLFPIFNTMHFPKA